MRHSSPDDAAPRRVTLRRFQSTLKSHGGQAAAISAKHAPEPFPNEALFGMKDESVETFR